MIWYSDIICIESYVLNIIQGVWYLVNSVNLHCFVPAKRPWSIALNSSIWINVLMVTSSWSKAIVCNEMLWQSCWKWNILNQHLCHFSVIMEFCEATQGQNEGDCGSLNALTRGHWKGQVPHPWGKSSRLFVNFYNLNPRGKPLIGALSNWFCDLAYH